MSPICVTVRADELAFLNFRIGFMPRTSPCVVGDVAFFGAADMIELHLPRLPVVATVRTSRLRLDGIYLFDQLLARALAGRGVAFATCGACRHPLAFIGVSASAALLVRNRCSSAAFVLAELVELLSFGAFITNSSLRHGPRLAAVSTPRNLPCQGSALAN